MVNRQIFSKIIDNLLLNNKMAFWEWDIVTNNVSVSPELYQLFGMPLGAVQRRKRFIEYIHSDDQEFVRHQMDQALKFMQPFKMCYRVIHPTGHTRIFYEQGDVQIGEDGKVNKIFAIITDISDLKLSPSFHYMVFPISFADPKAVVGHWEWMIDCHQLFLSAETCALLNLENLDTNPSQFDLKALLKLVVPSDRSKVFAAFEQAKTNGFLNVECLVQPKSSDIFKIHLNGEAIKGLGQSDRMIGTVRNMTHIMRKDKEKLKGEKLSVLSELAASLAHELLNPLTSLEGFIQLLKNEGLIKEMYSQVMDKELERLEFIVEGLLMLAKPTVMEFIPQSLEDLLTPILTQFTNRAKVKGIEFHVSFDQTLPLLNCVCKHICQLVYNLLQNALESMDGNSGGVISLSISQYSCNKIMMVIEDEGCGIPLHLMEKLGEPFYTTKEKGTGLGLMVVDRVVRVHGGKLSFHKKPSQGTRVEVVLPINY